MHRDAPERTIFHNLLSWGLIHKQSLSGSSSAIDRKWPTVWHAGSHTHTHTWHCGVFSNHIYYSGPWRLFWFYYVSEEELNMSKDKTASGIDRKRLNCRNRPFWKCATLLPNERESAGVHFIQPEACDLNERRVPDMNSNWDWDKMHTLVYLSTASSTDTE